jgi:hypothetical protein
MTYFDNVIIEESKGITFIVNNKVHGFWEQIYTELNKFRWGHNTAINLILTADYVNSEELLKVLVPVIEKKELIICLGPDDELSLEILKAFRYIDQPFIFNSVANDFAMLNHIFELNEDGQCDFYRKRYSKLLRYDQIALQWHLADTATYRVLEDTGSRILRLGGLKENTMNAESIIRDANIIHFDTTALKHSEFPARVSASQSGLSSEESCQLMRYAGISDKSQVISICGLDSALDIQGRSSNVLAQLCWYAIDGYQNRKKDFPAQTDHLIRYVIDDEEDLINLTFYKSNRSTRWWIESPDEIKAKMKEHSLYACSYEDYLSAVSKEPSDTIIKAKLWFDSLMLNK